MSEFSSLESVARRYAHRPGCRFVSACEVGIATYVMDLRVIVIESRPIEPIDEFLLRSLGLSIDDPVALSSFLGLDSRTVHHRLVELRRAEFIDVLPSSDTSSIHCVLTNKGRSAVDSMQRADLAEITLPNVVIHGFLRRPIAVRLEQLLKPSELKEREIRPIPPMPSSRPNPEDISLVDLTELIRRYWVVSKKGKKAPELVSVRSILKNVRTMYLPAVLLQYEMQGSQKQRQIAFAVDGLEMEEYARAFQERNGQSKIPDLVSETYRTTAQLASEYLPPHIVRDLGPLDEVDNLIEQLDVVEQDIDTREKRIEAEDRPDTKMVLREQIEIIQKQKSDLESKLAERRTRRLKTHGCRELLHEAIRDAKERLIIVSAFLSDSVVNQAFLTKLDTTLARGVRVWIAYGMGKQGHADRERTQRNDWIGAENGLNALREKYESGLFIYDQGNTHEKILLKDDEFVVTGSFNWLSFAAHRNRDYRYEDAILVKEPEAIREYAEDILKRFPV